MSRVVVASVDLETLVAMFQETIRGWLDTSAVGVIPDERSISHLARNLVTIVAGHEVEPGGR